MQKLYIPVIVSFLFMFIFINLYTSEKFIHQVDIGLLVNQELSMIKIEIILVDYLMSIKNYICYFKLQFKFSTKITIFYSTKKTCISIF